MSEEFNPLKQLMKKKIVYIDMDGVLVDLGKAFDKFFTLHLI